jgi:hypothetical protein
MPSTSARIAAVTESGQNGTIRSSAAPGIAPASPATSATGHTPPARFRLIRPSLDQGVEGESIVGGTAERNRYGRGES